MSSVAMLRQRDLELYVIINKATWLPSAPGNRAGSYLIEKHHLPMIQKVHDVPYRTEQYNVGIPIRYLGPLYP